MELLYNNKLIAEFMGGEEVKFSPLFGKSYKQINTEKMDCYVSLPKHVDARVFKYNKSWDWLMPVVQKCLTVGDNTDEWDALLNALQEVNIKTLYEATINFIQYYNENKRHN